MSLSRLAWVVVMGLGLVAQGAADQEPRLFGGGAPFAPTDLPPSRFRNALEQASLQARQRALDWLRDVLFPAADTASLNLDRDGGVYYTCTFPAMAEVSSSSTSEVPTVAAVLPVAPFPAALKFHSRPGAPNVIFLDFDGHNVTGTAWNSSEGRDPIPAVGFSSDTDYSTFSDAEQAAIKRIWQRLAEDYAPFNVDVTTEEPTTFNTRTARALITRSTDANGVANPSSGGGGVAYVNVFAGSSYAYYSPAWIYFNNLGFSEDFIAEAASHEVGHNLGLSHDGLTSGSEYYGGHGSGDISWGPIMGTGYNRNISQWSKGDYYLANNTQDDLSLLATKMAYRADDAANTNAGTAILVVTGTTNVLATTPETDPANTNPANKGVIERNTDVDVFAFTSGPGLINLTVRPWLSPARTRGGNLDVVASLYADGGTLLARVDPTDRTYAVISAPVTGGVFYLHIANSGTGDPLVAGPTGYTAYGSIGQYFITGSIPDANGLVIPPSAELLAADIVGIGQTSHTFTVIYSDDVGIHTASLDHEDLVVTGPRGYQAAAQFVSVDNTSPGTPRAAVYRIAPTGSAWTVGDAGAYAVFLASNQVADTQGAFAPPGLLGVFTCAVPVVIYAADLSTNPAWTFTGGSWAFGVPQGSSGDPASGYTGTNVIGYNLAGSYARNLSTVYARTPAIDCGTAQSVTLRFRRWLGVQSGDAASIQVSRDGSVWSNVWTSGGTITDTTWQEIQLDVTGAAAGQTNVQLRWGMQANTDTRVGCGWNLDDIQLLASGTTPDTQPPGALAAAADITIAGATSHVFTVTYTDATAVAAATFGHSNLTVTATNGFSANATFLGADVPGDGTPRIATYRIVPPGGDWDRADNAVYTIALNEGQVGDVAGHTMAAQTLGTFLVDIPEVLRTLAVVVTEPIGGHVEISPGGTVFTNGALVTLTAWPSNYFAFAGWSGAVTGNAASVAVTMTADQLVAARFTELATTNQSVPLWWLAQQGITNDFETGALAVGANGHLLWESWVAGLVPTNPASRLAAEVGAGDQEGAVIRWTAVTGRVYEVWSVDEAGDTYQPLATNLVWPANSLVDPASAQRRFYQLRVTRP